MLAGAAAGVVADIPALWMLRAFGSLDALSQAAHAPVAAAALAYIGMMLLGGVLYGWLFQRAANDARGGWLFGIPSSAKLSEEGRVASRITVYRHPPEWLGASRKPATGSPPSF